MSLFDLSGKVALVTGSTKGIGEAIVHRLAEHGAKVVVSSRKADACEKVAGDINKERGAIAAGLAADMIALPASPLQDIEVLRKVDFVMKDGKIIRQ